MSYKFSFADNATYNATDINSITKRLVTGGVGDSFENGVAYNVSKFNEAGKLLYTSGVVPETCLTLRVDKVSDTEILINPGNAFFNDGAVIEIEAGGETLSYISGKKNYVYLKNELVDKNICYPYCGIDEPTGDYVLLAEIDENGVISDKRTYARGRLPGYQSVAGNVLVIDETVETVAETNSNTLTGSATFDIGSNNYEYILVYTPFVYPGTYDPTLPNLGIYDIAKGTYTAFYATSTTDGGNGTTIPYRLQYSSKYLVSDCLYDERDTHLTFDLADGKLTVRYTRQHSSLAFLAGQTYPTEIKLFLF